MDEATRRAPHFGMRYVVLAFFALLACALCVLAVQRWGARDYVYGWNVAPNGTRLMYVAPGGAAAQAGLRAGDTIDWTHLPILGRANLGLIQTVAPGSTLRVRVQRSGAWRTVELTPKPSSLLYELGTHADLLARAMLMITGIILVY
ncbi:MAG TPA: hypothetical protein VFE17_06185, partial [Candidatus Baltobacteraceae bacterium]|nr:hypothetical protein [Candidatus Baltobacteraceae bacterium]